MGLILFFKLSAKSAVPLAEREAEAERSSRLDSKGPLILAAKAKTIPVNAKELAAKKDMTGVKNLFKKVIPVLVKSAKAAFN